MDDRALAELFLTHLVERAKFVRNGGRVVHYTSADSAFKILTGRQVWLRNATLMNDYSEMRHGLNCLQEAWSSTAGKRLQQWLDDHWPGFREELEKLFNSHADGIQNATYIMCLSEHGDDEDQYGRLSMWRAYGGRAGVAIAMNPAIFNSETNAMGVFSTPVVYSDINEFVDWFEKWVEKLIQREDDLKLVDRSVLQNIFFYAFRTFVLATKHPGFREEREWRVFHTAGIDSQTDWIVYDVEIIAGAPQHVVKLKLEDNADLGVVGCDPSVLVNRIIIGPSESPLPISNAILDAMTQVKIPDPAEKIWMSSIPLRHRD